MRNEQGSNSLTGRTAIADDQTMLRGPPKTVPCHPPTPPLRTVPTPALYAVIKTPPVIRWEVPDLILQPSLAGCAHHTVA